MEPRVLNAENFAQEAARYITSAIEADLNNKDRFVLGLCGGSTPKPVYELLRSSGINWNRVVVTFGDERCVPPDHADSNFKMASEALLSHVPIPKENILRIEGELEPKVAAQKYEGLLKEVLGPKPSHDLLLLGMGTDGHTASLFPGTEALQETQHLVVANTVPSLRTTRLTMTLPLIRASRRVCFLVNDPPKKAMVDAVLAGGEYPAGMARGVEETVWILGY